VLNSTDFDTFKHKKTCQFLLPKEAKGRPAFNIHRQKINV